MGKKVTIGYDIETNGEGGIFLEGFPIPDEVIVDEKLESYNRFFEKYYNK